MRLVENVAQGGRLGARDSVAEGVRKERLFHGPPPPPAAWDRSAAADQRALTRGRCHRRLPARGGPCFGMFASVVVVTTTGYVHQ
jgi:hypothetical protein